MPTVFLSIPTVELVNDDNVEFYREISTMYHPDIPQRNTLPDPDDHEYVSVEQFFDSVLQAQTIVEETLDLLDTHDIRGASVYYE